MFLNSRTARIVSKYEKANFPIFRNCSPPPVFRMRKMKEGLVPIPHWECRNEWMIRRIAVLPVLSLHSDVDAGGLCSAPNQSLRCRHSINSSHLIKISTLKWAWRCCLTMILEIDSLLLPSKLCLTWKYSSFIRILYQEEKIIMFGG